MVFYTGSIGSGFFEKKNNMYNNINKFYIENQFAKSSTSSFLAHLSITSSAKL